MTEWCDRVMGILLRVAGLLLVGVVLVGIGGWGVLAITYRGPDNESLRTGLSVLPALLTLAGLGALCFRRWRWRAVTACIVLFGAELMWWSTITPTNDREWQTDVAVLPHATIDGNNVTVHNIRNFDYRSEFDYTPAYYDKTFDLGKLQGVDVVAVYWMGPAIAHVFLSFDFGNDDHLAVSIETRKEVGESYSTIKGFFREYELYYVVADERDVIRLRTNYRQDPPEDVYVYRAAGDIAEARNLFMEYIRKINGLKTQPAFYNTLTTNCTTTIWMNTLVNPRHLPFNWKILVSGYLPELLYDYDRLQDGDLPFADVQRRAHVNARAQAAGDGPDFSRRIRQVDVALPVK